MSANRVAHRSDVDDHWDLVITVSFREGNTRTRLVDKDVQLGTVLSTNHTCFVYAVFDRDEFAAESTQKASQPCAGTHRCRHLTPNIQRAVMVSSTHARAVNAVPEQGLLPQAPDSCPPKPQCDSATRRSERIFVAFGDLTMYRQAPWGASFAPPARRLRRSRHLGGRSDAGRTASYFMTESVRTRSPRGITKCSRWLDGSTCLPGRAARGWR